MKIGATFIQGVLIKLHQHQEIHIIQKPFAITKWRRHLLQLGFIVILGRRDVIYIVHTDRPRWRNVPCYYGRKHSFQSMRFLLFSKEQFTTVRLHPSFTRYHKEKPNKWLVNLQNRNRELWLYNLSLLWKTIIKLSKHFSQ